MGTSHGIMFHDTRCNVSVPQGHPAVASSFPQESGVAPPLPPPRSPGGRRAEKEPWADRTVSTPATSFEAAPHGPHPETHKGNREHLNPLST